MQYSNLGDSGIKVSKICLGTMTWGEQNNEKEAHEQLDMALDYGVNIIDSAEIYPVPPKQESYGVTETYIGNWLKKRQNRDQVVLATKVAGRGDHISYIRHGEACLDRKNIILAVEASLRRLQTDYIDLYQLHWPDRNTNFFGTLGYQHMPADSFPPLQESLQALQELVQQGKVRHIGMSNETPWGAMRYLHLAQTQNLPKMQSIQNPYNLLNRTFEIGLAEIAHREQLGLLAYSPMGFGVLSGKYEDGAKPQGARLTLFSRFDRYNNAQALEATRQYVNLARQHDIDPAQMALAYVNSRGFLTSTIIGATNMNQLKADIESIDLKLSEPLLEAIEAIHTRMPNPSP